MERKLDESLNRSEADRVEVGAVIRCETYAAVEGAFENLFKLGVEEQLAVVAELDVHDPRIAFDQLPKATRTQMAGSQSGPNSAGCGWAGGASQLTDRSRLEPDPAGPQSRRLWGGCVVVEACVGQLALVDPAHRHSIEEGCSNHWLLSLPRAGGRVPP